MLSLREDFVGGRCVSKEPGGSRGPFGEIEDGSAAKQRADIRKSESVAAKKLKFEIWNLKFEIWNLKYRTERNYNWKKLPEIIHKFVNCEIVN